MEVTDAIRGMTVRPYSVRAVEQLPEALLELAKSRLPEGQAIEGIFVVPPETHKHGFAWRLNPLQALIFTKQGVLHLAASSRKGRPGDALWISVEDVFKIKFSLILLYEKLEIFAAHNEQPVKIELEYHAVGHNLLTPLLRGLMRKTWQKNPAALAQRPEDATFSEFVATSYSFYNGLKNEAIQPDERILGYVYQPEIHRPFLKSFYRKVFPKTALALTDQQLILLQEDLALPSHHEWIFTFIPLYRIASIQPSEIKAWQKISIHLNGGAQAQVIDLILEPVQAQKCRSLLNF